MDARLRTTILAFQLLASATVCLNHLSITLLKGVSPFFSSPIFAEPAEWGIVFLFASSGFLTHALRSNVVSAGLPSLVNELAFVCRRYWRFVLPVLTAVLFDKLAIGFTGADGPERWVRALPNIVTLSHTWVYNVLGDSTVPLPLGSSNMAWLGSNLFCVTVIYTLSSRLTMRLSAPAALGGVVGSALLYAAQYWILWADPDRINHWSASHYGSDMAGAYSFWSWLFEYCPYVHVSAFFSGVFLAQAVGRGTADGVKRHLPVICFLAVFLATGTPLAPPRGLGVSLLVLACLSTSTTRPFALAGDVEPARPGWSTRLFGCAYELFVLHLVFYNLFSLMAPPPITTVSVIILCGRVVAASAVTLLLCFGLSELVFEPARARINAFFGLAGLDDRFA